MNEIDLIRNKLKIIEGQKSAGEDILLQGKALQQIKTPYTTAVKVQEKRSLGKVIENLLIEADLAGGSFYYRWPVNGKDGKQSFVQGPSVDLAMSMARYYGNCAVDVTHQETASHFIFNGAFIDLETGFTVNRIFRQRKNQSMGSKMDADRQEDIVFQIGHSKAQRNAIIKAMPGWLVDQLIDVARESELEKIKKQGSLEDRRLKAVEFFSGYGVAEDALVSKIGKPVSKWSEDDVLVIREMAKSVKDGNVSLDELFPKEQSPTTEPKKEPVQEKKTEFNPPENPGIKKEPEQKEVQDMKVQDLKWVLEDFIGMRKGNGTTTGLMAYIMERKETFHDQPDEIKNAVLKKWANVYPDQDFPITIKFYGTGIASGFSLFCSKKNYDEVCLNIVNHPSRYNKDVKDGTNEAKFKFVDLIYIAGISAKPVSITSRAEYIMKTLADNAPEQEETESKIDCPDGRGDVTLEYCDHECNSRVGCPAHLI